MGGSAPFETDPRLDKRMSNRKQPHQRVPSADLHSSADPVSRTPAVIYPYRLPCVPVMQRLRLLVWIYASILIIGPAWAAEDIWKAPCVHTKRWKPTFEELKDASARQPAWQMEAKAIIHTAADQRNCQLSIGQTSAMLILA